MHTKLGIFRDPNVTFFLINITTDEKFFFCQKRKKGKAIALFANCRQFGHKSCPNRTLYGLMARFFHKILIRAEKCLIIVNVFCHSRDMVGFSNNILVLKKLFHEQIHKLCFRHSFFFLIAIF